MISIQELKKNCKCRLKDAEVLLQDRRYDGALYLCGYALELKLKVRICRTLKWPEFPETKKEFENYQSLKTHSLDVLLSLTGRESKIKTQHLTDWSIVANWEPEMRYQPVGKINRNDVIDMISATKRILKALI